MFLAVMLDAYSPPCHRLGPGSHAGGRTHTGRLTDGAVAPIHASGAGASFRSRFPVCQQRLHGPAQGTPDRHQHVAQGPSLGQRGLRVVHENPEVRGGPPQRISGTGAKRARRFASSWRRSTTRNACTPRSATCRRRSSRPTSRPRTNRMPLLYEFFQASGNLSIRWGRQRCGQRPRSSSG